MSEWHWETATEAALFPPTIATFVDGWRPWFGPLDDGTPEVAEIFAREFIQNFVDAADELREGEGIDSTPDLTFRFVRLTGSAASDLRHKLGLQGHVDRYQGMTAAERNSQRLDGSMLLSEPDGDLDLLIAQERFATGMYGPWRADGRAEDTDGRPIRRKMRDALVKPSGEKSSDTSRGSYGEGKRGVALASSVRTLLAYTCFREQPYDPRVTRRMLGISYWRKHIREGWEHTGLALFGKRGHDGETERATPFENDEADAFISDLAIEGLSVRDPDNLGDLGTSWVIVEPAFTAGELRDAVARNWWPLIESSDLHVSVVDNDHSEFRVSGGELEPLQPFINAFRIAAGLSPPRDRLDRLCSLSVRGAGIESLGTLGLTVDLEENGWSWDHTGSNAHMVAMIRGGMVIGYETIPRKRPTSIPPFVRGAFIVGDLEAQRRLRNAEPPLHNYWEESDRHQYPTESVELARQTYKKISKETAEFAKLFREDSPPQEFTFDVFARFFRTSEDAHVMPPPSSPPVSTVDPWSIVVPKPEWLEPLMGDPSQIRVTAERTLALKQDWVDDELPVQVRIGWGVLGDGAGRGLESELSDVDEDHVPEGFVRDGEFYRGVLTKSPVQFSWKSRFYTRDWVTRAMLSVQVSEVGGEGDG